MKISKQTRAFVILTILCVTLFGLRILKTHEFIGISLLWNLFLAWIPLFFALLAGRLKKSMKLRYICFALWLLFFPNAPYIITDLVHLDHLPKSLWWYDSLGIFTVAATGLLLGIYSISIIHKLWKADFGSVKAWVAIAVSMLLSGFGIYLGRFLRFNSWDIITNPLHLFLESLAALQEPLAMKTTLTFAITLMGFYIAFYTLTKKEHGLQKTH